MDIFKDYYRILGIGHDSSDKDIKKSYYKLSFTHHPDKGGDESIFSEITEAYDVLLNSDVRSLYDAKSKWGKEYIESNEMFNIDFINVDFSSSNKNYENFKKGEVPTIIVNVDEILNDSLSYDRWIMCGDCGGSGKDLKSSVIVKNEFGDVVGIFESSDECDFCDGSGEDESGEKCGLCLGVGKVGATDCLFCSGSKRIKISENISNISSIGILSTNDGYDEFRLKGYGNFSKFGEVGDLVIKVNKTTS